MKLFDFTYELFPKEQNQLELDYVKLGQTLHIGHELLDESVRRMILMSIPNPQETEEYISEDHASILNKLYWWVFYAKALYVGNLGKNGLIKQMGAVMLHLEELYDLDLWWPDMMHDLDGKPIISNKPRKED